MVNSIEQELGKEWSISPAGGLTGDVYIATKENQRLFLKRNSSPFLAVLSAEGIVPKLIWTKRMQNGGHNGPRMVRRKKIGTRGNEKSAGYEFAQKDSSFIRVT